jgi:hypothetical protein
MEEDRKKKRNRPDHDGVHRSLFDKNKKRIYASQNTCGICGAPVDKSLKYPHPLSPCIDHIIPIDRGGHPSDIDNLQLAHWKCNRMKANKLIFPLNGNGDQSGEKKASRINSAADAPAGAALANRDLPLSLDWSGYKATDR